jgi:hypothetical protein
MKLKPLTKSKGGAKGTRPDKPLIRRDDKIWSSPGVTDAKPTWCKNNCPFATTSAGFVRDHIPNDPKILVLFPTPQKDDVILRQALASGFKRWFMWKIVGAAGLEKKDVAVAHMLRCYCGPKYPTGKFVGTAENVCRHYDYEHNAAGKAGVGGIADVFDPDLFFLTLDPRKAMGTQALYRLFQQDFNRCANMIHHGYKPALLCGGEVASMIAPFHLAGGIKDWRGHWWESAWPFRRGQGASRGKGFR